MDKVLQKKLHKKIDVLLDDYKTHPDFLEKIENYIMKELPTTLRSINNTQMERENRKQNLEENSNIFIQDFLQTSLYYYCNSTEIFFEYKNNHFSCIREDSVLCNILNSISANKEIMPWKYKIKISLMKRIKEQDIFHCTPNTETIQTTMRSIEECCNINKEQAKYFLTIIGDILLKKNNLIYFINNNIKHFLKEINNHAYLLFGSPSIMTHFKFKYHDHKYDECRLLDFKSKLSEDIVKQVLKPNIINILVVSLYYSSRYENADNFICHFCKNEIVKSRGFYLKNMTEETIIDDFMKIMMEPSLENTITWKDISYLWKLYNELYNYPQIMFQSKLYEMISNKNENYNKETDSLHNITSSYLPDVKHFIEFWNKEVYSTEDQYEYEIDEIFNLFQNMYKSGSMSEEKLLSLIKHYYPETIVEDDKYFLNIGCYSWDKNQEAYDFINTLKESNIESNIETLLLDNNIDVIYEIYKKNHNNPKKRLSKRYFEKFMFVMT
jgi:hypothetical protein